jgi:hypothetical protein
MYASLPEPDWVAKFVPADDDVPSINKFRELLKSTNQPFADLQLGQTFDIDGVHIQVFGIRNPEFIHNCLNNSSVVLKMSDAKKSVLFLGDLGIEGGKKLLHGDFANQLHSDYVQMAHHGQNGVGEAVYQAISPTYCLWPTPLWLWDNNPGQGKGAGKWKTLVVRAWMEKLNVKHNYVMADGLQKID